MLPLKYLQIELTVQNSNVNNIVKKKTAKQAKQERTDDLLEQSRSYKYSYNPRTIILNDNPAEIAKLTRDQCWRPDIYLDMGCSKCALVEHCTCRIKNKKKF